MTNDEVKTHRLRTAPRKGSLEKHNGIWRIVAQVNGRKIRQSTGTPNRKEAERIRLEFMAQFTAHDEAAQAEKMVDLVRTKTARAIEAERRSEEALPALKIADAIHVYLTDSRRKIEDPTAPGTDKNSRIIFGRFARWVAKHHPDCVELRQVSSAIAEEYAIDLHGNLSPTSFGRHIAVLKRVWNVLGERARCFVAPWAKIKKSGGNSYRREIFTPEQTAAIFAKLEPGTEFHALCAIGAYTGLRLGDAATLKWSSLHFDEGMIVVLPRKVKKYGKTVRIPISKYLRPTLEALPRVGEYVLPQQAKDYIHNPTILSTRFGKLLRSAGLEPNVKVEG